MREISLSNHLGTLDTPFDKRAKAHTFVDDKAPWHNVDGNLPQFSEWASIGMKTNNDTIR